jgi:hypothetical protein
MKCWKNWAQGQKPHTECKMGKKESAEETIMTIRRQYSAEEKSES